MRRLLFAFLCLAQPACDLDLDVGSSSEPIVNGLATHGFPSVGNLLYGSVTAPISDDNQQPWCTGTLIGARTFLTAAHCVEDDLAVGHYRVFFQNAGSFAVT